MNKPKQTRMNKYKSLRESLKKESKAIEYLINALEELGIHVEL